MNGWSESVRFVFVDGTLLIALFVVITFAVLLIQQLSVGDSVQRALNGSGAWRGAAVAAFGGAVTPFCSCSTVPVLSGMLRARIRLSACFAFLIASPVINEGVVILLGITFGAASALSYVALAALLCVMAAVAVERLGMARWLRTEPQAAGLPEGWLSGGAARARPPLAFALHTAWAATRLELRRLAPYLGAGILVGALIYGHVPTDALARLTAAVPPGSAVVLAALVAAPLYVSPMVAVPVGLALIDKGLDPGPVIAFLIAGAGTSLPEMILLGRMFHWPLLLAHIAAVVLAAILLGYTAQWALTH